MIQKSIKIGIQRLLSYKAYSLINISGLAIAIAVCLAILLYAHYHSSFDKYISNGENSYRLISRIGDGTYSTNTFAGFDDVLSDCPEIESHTLCYTNHRIDEVIVEENKIKVEAAIFANESFLKYFSVKMIEGDKESINQPNTVMITPDMADKLFPGENAMGQTVFLRSFTANQDSLIAFSISGIIKPLPAASQIKYEMLLSQKGHFYPTVKLLKSRKLYGGNLYLKLYPSANVQDLEKRLTALIEPVLGNAVGPPLKDYNHKLQAVYDIHFTPGLRYEIQPTVRRSSHNILIMVGFLIFALATMNFVIMYIARASFYQKARLIIRFFGGAKKHLFGQTIIEVFISVCLSFFTAFVLLLLFQNYLATHFFPDWKIPFQSPAFWIITISLFLLVNIVVSVLTSLNLLKRGAILQQTTRPEKFHAAILLVIFQFAMVIALIGFTIVINLQMKFIDKKDLGYSSENVMVIRVPQSNAKVHILKEELAVLPGIISTGTAHHYPGYNRLQDMNFSIEENLFPFKFGFIDQQAIQTLDIKPLMYFTDAKEKATNGWIINETFYNNLKSKYSDEQIATSNFPDDESQTENEADEKFIIHGVISDFHYATLHSEIENFAFYIRKSQTRYNRFVLARFEQNRTKEVIAAVENKMAKIYPGQPIKYSFLDEQLHSQYASEQILLKLINAFSILAILVACFGLIGLSIFITEKRTKEIGIRRVNGASVYEILRMLNMDFAIWVGISFVIATPVAFYAT
ncbi:MAG: ABC transporter permease, partial [Bacteroidota bacterium]